MGSSATDYLSSFAFEQSLRRSFSAIHRPSVDASDGSGSHTKLLQDLKRNRRDQVIRSKSIQRRNRRGSIATTTDSPTSSRAVITPPLSCDELPPLPFSKDNSAQQPQRERSAKKFQRQYSHATSVEKRRAVTFAPSLPLSSSVENDTKQTVEEEQQNKGFRRDYSIGETIRSQCHMIIDPTSEVGLLNKHDFAFVKRSGGSHSYAILAYRSMELIKGTTNTEECMVFVISDTGSTKMVRKRDWGEFVHLVSMEGM